MLFPASWAPLILIDAGVPYLHVLDAFDNIMLLGGNFISLSDRSSKQLDNIKGVIEIIQFWLNAATADNATIAKSQLQATVGTSILHSKLDMIKSQIVATSQASLLLDDILHIEESLRNFQA
jgi:hypothetical protein